MVVASLGSFLNWETFLLFDVLYSWYTLHTILVGTYFGSNQKLSHY